MWLTLQWHPKTDTNQPSHFNNNEHKHISFYMFEHIFSVVRSYAGFSESACDNL